MYVRVLQDELQFPEDRAMDQDTKSLIRGVRHSMPLGSYRWRSDTLLQLLQRNPALRMKEPRIKKHPYFSMMYVFYPPYLRFCPHTGFIFAQRLVPCVFQTLHT